MLPTTLEWVKKAEADYDVVLLLLKSRKLSRHDTICFALVNAAMARYALAVVNSNEILGAIDVIAATYKPQKIVLFGSYAYGIPTPDSDVDLLVLKDFRGTPHQQFVRIIKKLNVSFPLDLLVRRPDVVKQRIEGNDFFLREVMEKGIVLYAGDDLGVGEKGRNRLRRHLNSAAIQKAHPV